MYKHKHKHKQRCNNTRRYTAAAIPLGAAVDVFLSVKRG